MEKGAEMRPGKPERVDQDNSFPDQGEVSITSGFELKKKKKQTRNNRNKKQVGELFIRNSMQTVAMSKPQNSAGETYKIKAEQCLIYELCKNDSNEKKEKCKS